MTPLRPKMRDFRVTDFSSQHGDPLSRNMFAIELHQEIMVALSEPVPDEPLHVAVQIRLRTEIKGSKGSDRPSFMATYLATFAFPDDVELADAEPWVADELNQYGVVAQAFPLAMTHFKREMQATGFDARELPLGI